MSDDIFRCHGEAIRETDMALLIHFYNGPWRAQEWIPKSAIHDDSEVYLKGHAGEVVIAGWVAKDRGLTTSPPPRRHLDLSGRWSPSTAHVIIRSLRDIVAAERSKPARALCEWCTECTGNCHSTGDNAAAILDQAIAKLEEAIK